MTTITIPRETFDQMREALEDLKRQYKDQPSIYMDWSKAREALSAAKAVSEVSINGLTEAETSASMSVMGLSKKAVQPQAQGEASCGTCGNPCLAVRTDVHKDKREFMYCDCCGAMADRKTWNRAHPQASEPKAQGNEGVIEERMALADLCDAMGSPNIAEYLRAQAEISRKEPTT